MQLGCHPQLGVLQSIMASLINEVYRICVSPLLSCIVQSPENAVECNSATALQETEKVGRDLYIINLEQVWVYQADAYHRHLLTQNARSVPSLLQSGNPLNK